MKATRVGTIDRLVAIVLGLFATFMAHQAAEAQIYPISLGLEYSGSVGAGEQRRYSFPVRKMGYYWVEVTSFGGDPDVYGHWDSSVGVAKGVDNQGFSCHLNATPERFSLESNYDGSYYLAVHGATAASYSLVVRQTDRPRVTVNTPSGTGEVWTVGETKPVSWTPNVASDQYKIYVSRDGGAFEPVGTVDRPGTSFPWTVSGAGAKNCKVRIETWNFNAISVKHPAPRNSRSLVYPYDNYKTFTIASSDILDHIEIEGVSSINAGGNAQFTCMAVSTNGNRTPAPSNEVTWSRVSGPVSITSPGGYLTAGTVSPPYQEARIRASFSGKYDYHDVRVVYVSPGTPGIGHTPSSLSPSCVSGAVPAEQTIFVWNNVTGSGALSYVVSSDESWVLLSPATGSSTGETDGIKVNYTVSSFPPGPYTASITISAPTQPGVTPQVIPVSLTVNEAATPSIGRSPTSLSTSCEQGQNPANQTFEIWNAGGGTLDFTIAETADWIANVSPSSGSLTGSTHQTITVTYSAAAKIPGTYNTSISITDPEASPTTQTVAVALVVTQPAAPPPPSLNRPSPDMDVESDHTFSWYPVSGATGYRLWVAKNGTDVVHNQEHSSTTLSVPVMLPSFGKYVWKVCAKNGADNWGVWSAPRTAWYRVPEEDPVCQQNQVLSNEPVNTYSGAYVYSREDLSLPGRGLPFEFARFYNSRAAGTTSMGAKWRHTFMVALEEDPSDGSVVIRWANCSEDSFTPVGAGQYENTYFGYSGRLTKNLDGSFDFRTKALVTYHFDSAGVLLSIADRNGNTLTLQYSAGTLDSVTDTVGRVIDFQYDGGGKLWKVVDSIGRELVFEYTDDDLTSFTDMLGHSMSYSYDSEHNMTSIVDRRGNPMVTNVYDAESRVTSQTSASSDTWTYDFTPEGMTTETDPLSGANVYEYNDFSWIEKRTDARGNFEQYAYDENGNRTEILNARGFKTLYSYDPRGNVTSLTDALGNETAFEYNEADQVTVITDPLGRETRFEYDAGGNLTTVSRPLGHVTTFEYDVRGQLVRAVDAMGRTTEYGYDAQGNRISATNALGEITQFVYDGAGRLTGIVEPTGAESAFAYDSEDNLTSVTDQEDHVTEYAYDENGNRRLLRNPKLFETEFVYDANNLVTTIVDAYTNEVVYGYDELTRLTSLTDRRGKVFTYEYDPVGNRVKVIDAYAKETRSTYDARGNVVAVTNANGHTTTFTYDALNRLVRITDAVGNRTEYTYDSVGRLTEMKDGNDSVTAYTYDDLDRLVRVEDPELGTAEYAYDLNGNRIAITDPNGHVTSFEYDALDRVVSETDALGKTVRYTYDEAGNLLTRKDARGYTTSYAYYPTHRLQTVGYPNGSSVAFTYDENGNRLQMVDPTGTTAWTYDNLDRIAQVTDPFGKAVGYGYDEESNRTAIEYDALNPGSRAAAYTFDDNGRLKTLTDWAGHTFTYTYDDAGNVTQLDYPNGCKEKRTYYNNGRLETLTHERPDATQLVAYTYYYDGAGNITSMDRKEAVEREFDAELTNYTYNDANEILTAGTSTFRFDANGNQTRETAADGTTQYSYDFENRLTQLDPPGAGNAMTFGYNGVGDRLKTVDSGTEKRYLLDINKALTDVLADMNASNDPQQYYLYGLGLVGRVDAATGDLYQYHPDHLGSIMAVTGHPAATTTAAFVYDEFGAVAAQTGDDAGPWRFCGAFGVQKSQDNKVLFSRARYLAPALGRFLHTDPLVGTQQHTQSMNAFSYVRQNPLKLVDPSGLTWWNPVSWFVADVEYGSVGYNGYVVLGDAFSVVQDTATAVGKALEAPVKALTPGRSLEAPADFAVAISSMDKAMGNAARLLENISEWSTGQTLTESDAAGPLRSLIQDNFPEQYELINGTVELAELAYSAYGFSRNVYDIAQWDSTSARQTLTLAQGRNSYLSDLPGPNGFSDLLLSKYADPAISAYQFLAERGDPTGEYNPSKMVVSILGTARVTEHSNSWGATTYGGGGW